MRESDSVPKVGQGHAAKPVPRFVPTLTEVVDPADLNRMAPAPEPKVEELIELVRSRVQPQLERRVEQVLYRLVGELIAQKWSAISSDLSKEVTDLIAQAVRDAMAQHGAKQS
jgi:hypothetical protein